MDDSDRVFWHVDLLEDGWYVRDFDRITRSTGSSVNGCLSVNSNVGLSYWVRAVDPYGRSSPIRRLKIATENWTSLDGQIAAGSPSSATGIDTAADPASGGETVLRFVTTATFNNVIRKNETSPIVSSTISLKLQRGVDGALRAPDRFSAQWTVATHSGTLTGEAHGEAIFADGVWALRGSTSVQSGTWEGASAYGGFYADITINDVGTQNDSITWSFDGLSYQ